MGATELRARREGDPALARSSLAWFLVGILGLLNLLQLHRGMSKSVVHTFEPTDTDGVCAALPQLLAHCRAPVAAGAHSLVAAITFERPERASAAVASASTIAQTAPGKTRTAALPTHGPILSQLDCRRPPTQPPTRHPLRRADGELVTSQSRHLLESASSGMQCLVACAHDTHHGPCSSTGTRDVE